METGAAQLDLDFGAPVADGYANWQWDRRQAQAKIAEEWGIPLNRRVRVRLRGVDEDFEGMLFLAADPERIDHRLPLTLRLASIVFLNTDIESCSVVG